MILKTDRQKFIDLIKLYSNRDEQNVNSPVNRIHKPNTPVHNYMYYI